MNHLLPSYPPVHTHHSRPLSLEAAQSKVNHYLSSLRTTPHHHPDALITPGGVTFHPSSGPVGNLQITNLRRISSGLAGENLSLSPDDLLALELSARKAGAGLKREADDAEEDDNDSFVFDGDVLRRRLKEGVGLSGIGPSRQRGLEKSDGTPVRGVLKKRKTEEGSQEVGVGDSQDSVSAGALRRRDERRHSLVKVEEGPKDEGEEKPEREWMDMQEWAETRQPVEGEVGDRDGAPVVRQDGVEPVVRETVTDGDGEVRVKNEDGTPLKSKFTEAQKAQRKENKKQRKKEQQLKKEWERSGHRPGPPLI